MTIYVIRVTDAPVTESVNTFKTKKGALAFAAFTFRESADFDAIMSALNSGDEYTDENGLSIMLYSTELHE